MEPSFWLGLSILLVALSITAVLVAALPAFRELARAARSAEKLFDTLSRELPPTLEAIRLTGMEITDLKEDVSDSVQSAGRVVQQVDQSVSGVRKQAQQAQTATRSVFAGVRAAWQSLNRSPSQLPARSVNRLTASQLEAEEFEPEVETYESSIAEPIAPSPQPVQRVNSNQAEAAENVFELKSPIDASVEPSRSRLKS